ncbi:hypothetical protein ACQ86D_02240 [Streptomyces galilaeus]
MGGERGPGAALAMEKIPADRRGLFAFSLVPAHLTEMSPDTIRGFYPASPTSSATSSPPSTCPSRTAVADT